MLDPEVDAVEVLFPVAEGLVGVDEAALLDPVTLTLTLLETEVLVVFETETETETLLLAEDELLALELPEEVLGGLNVVNHGQLFTRY